MNQNAATSFAEWLAHDQPELFVALFRHSLTKEQAQSLNGFTDVLSSIGTGLSSAVQQVGQFISSPAGMTTIGAVATTYLQSKAARQALDINLQRAQQGQTAAPIQTVYNPNTMQYEAVLQQSGGYAVPLTQSVSRQLAGMPTWLPWAIGGGLLVVLLLSRR